MMWIVFFPIIALLYVLAFLVVVMLKAFLALTYCFVAVAAWCVSKFIVWYRHTL